MQIFQHEQYGKIRTIMIDGKLYFVGKDVALALGYKNTKDALSKHVKEKYKEKCEVAFHDLTSRARKTQNMTVIDESGLYCLVLASKLPSAEKFQDWVVEEILPTIRKTGSYNPNPPRIEEKSTVYIENLNVTNNYYIPQKIIKEKKMNNIDVIKSKLEEYTNEVTSRSKAGGTDMYCCPVCGSGVGKQYDGKRHTGAFHLYDNKLKFKCHSCGINGTIIDLYGKINNIDPQTTDGKRTIIKALEQKYNIEDNFSFQRVSAQEDFKNVVNYDWNGNPEQPSEERNYKEYEEKEILNTIAKAKINTLREVWRGISADVLNRFGVGFVPNYIHPKTKYSHSDNPYLNTWATPRMVIPTSDSSYIARATEPEPPQNDPKHKYYVKVYKTTPVKIFNPDDLINKDGYCYVVEGEIDALSCIECGFHAIGLGSTSMIESLFRDYTIDKNVVLIIAMDNDTAGAEAIPKLEKLCKANRQPYIIADSNILFDSLKDANDLLQKDRAVLRQNLRFYINKALNFDKDKYLEQLETSEKEKVSSMGDNINSTIEDTIPIPEITFENIETPEILGHIYNLKSKSDILNYIQLLESKAREYKKISKISPIIKEYKKEALKQLKEQELQNKISSAPKWLYLDDRNQIRINEPLFCKIKAQELQCKTINGNIRTIDGKQLDDMELLSKIQAEFEGNILNNIAKRSRQLLEALKNATFSKLPPYDNKIHLVNGTYNVASMTFENKKYWCINRLSVAYNPIALRPTKWIAFLNDLLETDDIITLQEYLGYCLIQSTALQLMLFLIGNGGEGKSVIGKVLNALMGDDNVYIDKIHELQKNRFKLINLENKLLFIDDDLQTNALNDTGIIKTLITGGKSSLEPKGKPSYNAELYARGLCFGNIPLTALYDHSDGFYRRQIIIKTKPKSSDRTTNFFLDQDIIKTELEGILLWCLEGLHRLIDHNFNIYISKASEENLQEAKKNAFNFILFLEDSEEVEFNTNHEESATDIYANYCRWCCANGLDELKRRSVIDYLHTHEKEYQVKYSENCHEYQTNKRVRGFKGLHLKKHFNTYSSMI